MPEGMRGQCEAALPTPVNWRLPCVYPHNTKFSGHVTSGTRPYKFSRAWGRGYRCNSILHIPGFMTPFTTHWCGPVQVKKKGPGYITLCYHQPPPLYAHTDKAMLINLTYSCRFAGGRVLHSRFCGCRSLLGLSRLLGLGRRLLCRRWLL